MRRGPTLIYGFITSLFLHGIGVLLLFAAVFFPARYQAGEGYAAMGVSFVPWGNLPGSEDGVERALEFGPPERPEQLPASAGRQGKDPAVSVHEPVLKKILRGPESRIAEQVDKSIPAGKAAGSNEAQAAGGAARAGSGSAALLANGGFGFGGAAGAGVRRPTPLFAPKPPFPYAARQAGFEGKVVLNIMVGADGHVRDASVIQTSSRADCDEAAVKTILERWRFEPASLNGQSIDWREKVIVSYRLQ